LKIDFIVFLIFLLKQLIDDRAFWHTPRFIINTKNRVVYENHKKITRQLKLVIIIMLLIFPKF